MGTPLMNEFIWFGFVSFPSMTYFSSPTYEARRQGVKGDSLCVVHMRLTHEHPPTHLCVLCCAVLCPGGGVAFVYVVVVVVQAVDDDFTRSASSGGVVVGGMVGEATTEAEHRVIEELGPKRRLLMAVNESKTKPVRDRRERERKEIGDRRQETTRHSAYWLGRFGMLGGMPPDPCVI